MEHSRKVGREVSLNEKLPHVFLDFPAAATESEVEIGARPQARTISATTLMQTPDDPPPPPHPV